MMKVVVKVPYIDGVKEGDVVEMNERRAKSEIRHGNVEVYKPKAKPKARPKAKMEKPVYKNKAYKGKTTKK